MPQEQAFKTAIENLTAYYIGLITQFSCKDFLKSSIDPFRFNFNVQIWGLNEAVRKEIEHKIEMKLEDLFGDFHEDYLGNCIHEPTNTRWDIVPPGKIPGVDVANRERDQYLQIKSKFNSMNSSSAKRLARELDELKKRKPNSLVGCGWVIASKNRRAIGENDIKKVAHTLKGKDLFAFITGNKNEMDELVEQFPILLGKYLGDHDFEELLSDATSRVIQELESRARLMGTDVRGYLYHHAVG